MADFKLAEECMGENIRLLNGSDSPQDLVLMNLSNAVYVILKALDEIQSDVRSVRNSVR